jgi:transposase
MSDVTPLRPKMLDDVTDVEAKLVAMLEEGRGREVIRMMLALLVDLRERHTSAEVRLHGLLRKVYGRSSEKIAATQLELYLAMLGTPKPKPKAEGDKPPPNVPAPDTKPAPKGGGGRKPLPEDLPVEVVELHVPEAERACPYCGKERTSCGHDVARLIEYVPPSFKIIEERREKLVCRPCGEITTAPMGARVIDGGRPGPQLVAALIVDKWQDATPHHRNADIFARLGVHFARQRLTDWAAAGLDALGPIAWRITQRVLAATYVNIDDTGLRVLDRDHPAGVKRGHMWAMVASEPKLVAYFYTKDWSADGPAEMLVDFVGYLQSDEYAGFEKIAEDSGSRITRLGCHMHARRKFEAALDGGDVRAAIAMDLYKKIYAVERACKDAGLGADARRARRLEETAPLLDELKAWAVELHPRLTPSSPLRKGTTYLTGNWDVLTRFLEDGRLEIDNGIVERELRRVALGRKNWMFAGSDEGAERAAVAFTVLATCRMLGVEPSRYIADVLRKLHAGWPMSRIDELLPDVWARAKQCAENANAEQRAAS